MNIFSLPFLLSFLLFLTQGSAKVENEKTQEYLTKILESSNYDSRVAPEGISGPGSPVHVNVTMYIIDISRVDDYSKDFDAQFYFRQSWYDPRLQFSESKLNYVILREVDKIWTPDLFFINEKLGSLHKVIQPNIFCKISPDGTVLFSIRVTERLSCLMDLRKYPLDTQNCNVRAESYGYTRKHIELKWGQGKGIPVSATPSITEDEFVLLDVEPEVKYENVSSGSYSTLEVYLKFQRKFGYFAKKLYVPLTILVLCSWLSLWIKAKAKYLRLALLLVILYLMVTLTSEFESNVPYAPYIKASDVWIGFCVAMVFAAFLEFIVVCITATEAEENNSRPKGEILSTLDPEAKDTNISSAPLKSPLNKFMNMFDVRNGNRGRYDLSHRVDRICRILFPTVFILFNIVYWSVYCSP